MCAKYQEQKQNKAKQKHRNMQVRGGEIERMEDAVPVHEIMVRR